MKTVILRFLVSTRNYNHHIDGLVHDCSISSVLAIEILPSWAKPQICLFCTSIYRLLRKLKSLLHQYISSSNYGHLTGSKRLSLVQKGHLCGDNARVTSFTTNHRSSRPGSDLKSRYSLMGLVGNQGSRQDDSHRQWPSAEWSYWIISSVGSIGWTMLLHDGFHILANKVNDEVVVSISR